MRPGAVLGRDFLGIVTGGALPVRDLAQPGHAGGAIGPGEGAAGVEAAAARGVHGARDVAREQDAFPGALGDRVGRAGAEKAFLTVTDFLRWWLGRLILFAARGQVPPSASSDDRALMERLAPAAALDRWLEVWEKINLLLARASGANLDRKQVFLNAFFALERAAQH